MNAKLLIALALSLCSAPLGAEDLSAQFAKPPASARPWVYWFWNNGNVTRAGITADLEAIQREGIGGVIIMDVVERFAPPPGTADFMNAEWQELFHFAVAEAHRLGLEINMTNGPGWCGSSGPWITPELSMQMLVSTNLAVEGPVHFSAVLSRPDIGSAWDVRFPPKWGAPEKITLDHLISLSDSTNDGVKYFSGTATYTKTFDWKPASGKRGQKSEIWLDLGDVQVMARVKLNGQDLGILWKPPFRANVTTALKSGQNKLEIQVADLWPNRMIGDAALPAAERFTWSSYEPFTKDSPLPKSGLLGPVKLQTSEIISLP